MSAGSGDRKAWRDRIMMRIICRTFSVFFGLMMCVSVAAVIMGYTWHVFTAVICGIGFWANISEDYDDRQDNRI